MTTIPLSALIAAVTALDAVVAHTGTGAMPIEVWRRCLDAQMALGWRVDRLVAEAAPVEVTA